MTSAQVFWGFATALTIGALLTVLQPMVAGIAVAKGRARRVQFLAGLAITLVALAGYLAVGRPDLIGPESGSGSGATLRETSIPHLIKRLEAHLQQRPGDADAALLLARSYYAAARFAEAVPAFERAFVLKAPAAPQLADYADARTAQTGGTFDAQAQKAVERALALDAQHVKSLWLAGSFAFNDRRPADAIVYWTRLAPLLPADSEELRRLQANIAGARAQVGIGSAVAGNKKQLSGTVAIAPELQASVGSTDTLYVFARGLQGPPMPLAVFKAVPGRWPVAFSLDESMAVMGGARLSERESAMVVARISRSGQAIGQPGDLESGAVQVKVGAAGIQLLIDTVRK